MQTVWMTLSSKIRTMKGSSNQMVCAMPRIKLDMWGIENQPIRRSADLQSRGMKIKYRSTIRSHQQHRMLTFRRGGHSSMDHNNITIRKGVRGWQIKLQRKISRWSREPTKTKMRRNQAHPKAISNKLNQANQQFILKEIVKFRGRKLLMKKSSKRWS